MEKAFEYFEIALLVLIVSIILRMMNEYIASAFGYPKSSIAFKNIKSLVRSASNFGFVFSIFFLLLYFVIYFKLI